MITLTIEYKLFNCPIEKDRQKRYKLLLKNNRSKYKVKKNLNKNKLNFILISGSYTIINNYTRLVN